MNSMQKVVKYCAMAFAIILATGIILSLANVAIAVIGGITNGVHGNVGFGNMRMRDRGELIDFSSEFTNVKSIDIENSVGSFEIKIGDNFYVDASNVSENFRATVTNSGTLKIEDKYSWDFVRWFDTDDTNTKVVLYLPEDFVAKQAKISSGAGKIAIDALATQRLSIKAGAGNLIGSNITAEDVDINGGVGMIKFTEVNFTDTDIDCGVGSVIIEGQMFGKNKISCGVGELSLKLKGSVDDYDLDIEPGVGTIRVNGDKVTKLVQKGNFKNHSLKVNGGVGTVRIDIYE